MYEPKLARFSSRDPLYENEPVLIVRSSPFAYVENNPVNDTDPSGLQAKRADRPKKLAGAHKTCVDGVKTFVLAALRGRGAECFRPARGKPAIGDDKCLKQLIPCIREGFKKITLQTQLGGKCKSQARCGYIRGSAPCPVSKDLARNSDCKIVCKKGRIVKEFKTDPGCGLCPDNLVKHSPVVLCLGSTGPGDRGGNAMPASEAATRTYCGRLRGVCKVAVCLLHEVMHNCLGGHKKKGRAAEPDKCGRADAAVAAGRLRVNCLPRCRGLRP